MRKREGSGEEGHTGCDVAALDGAPGDRFSNIKGDLDAVMIPFLYQVAFNPTDYFGPQPHYILGGIISSRGLS